MAKPLHLERAPGSSWLETHVRDTDSFIMKHITRPAGARDIQRLFLFRPDDRNVTIQNVRMIPDHQPPLVGV
jgi:hypothetical protein